ncbi:hypothetical protein CF336_g9544, partial [Tilletia laevis]
FLSCLEWFREVILPDAAVLSLRAYWSEFQFFPTCATFASAEFHQFAAELAKSMKTADSESERQLAQLPKQLGAGVKNALVDFKSDAERRDEEMHKKLDLCIELILRQANTIPTLNTSTTPAAHFIDTLPSIASASSFSITADPQNPTPLRASALVGTPALLPLQIQAATPSSPSLSLLSPPNSTSLPANTPSLLSLPLATVPSPRAPSAAPPSFDISGSSDRALTYLNRIMAPASQQTALAPAFIAHLPETTALTSATAGSAQTQQQISELMVKEEARWGKEKVAANEHWAYVAEKNIILPRYQFRPGPSVRDTWAEYSVGANGRFGTRMMEETWGTGWRSGPGMKQEWSRRKKVIDLLEDITRSRPSWTQEHAIRFMEACFGGYTTRGLSDCLAKTAGSKGRANAATPSSTSSAITPSPSSSTVPAFVSAREVIFKRLSTWSP